MFGQCRYLTGSAESLTGQHIPVPDLQQGVTAGVSSFAATPTELQIQTFIDGLTAAGVPNLAAVRPLCFDASASAVNSGSCWGVELPWQCACHCMRSLDQCALSAKLTSSSCSHTHQAAPTSAAMLHGCSKHSGSEQDHAGGSCMHTSSEASLSCSSMC